MPHLSAIFRGQVGGEVNSENAPIESGPPIQYRSRKGIAGRRGTKLNAVRGGGGDMGHIFHFTEIGYFDTEAAAFQRGMQWARAWLDFNF
jgi:hypothetical protein